MKKILKKAKKHFKNEIEFAKKAGFEGILIRLPLSDSCIYLETIYDEDTLEDIVFENGWDSDCIMLNFANNSQKIIHLHEAVA